MDRIAAWVRTERAKLQGMSLRGKLSYIVTYYWVQLALIVFILVFGLYLHSQMSVQLAENHFAACFGNTTAELGPESDFGRGFAQYAGYDLKQKNLVLLDECWCHPGETSAFNNTYYNLLVTYLDSGTLDVLVMPAEDLAAVGQSGRLMDLRDSRTAALFAAYADRLVYVTPSAQSDYTVATQDVRLLRHQLDQVFALPGTYTFLNYLRCHDDIGWGLDYGFLSRFGQSEVPHKRYLNDYLTGHWPGSASRGELYNDDPRLGDARLCGTTASLCGAETDEALAYRRMEMLHAFLLTLSGVPVLYSGDEIGQKNDYAYHDDPLRREDSRYLHRGAFSWSDAQKRADPQSWQGIIYRMIGELTRIRRENRAFDARAGVFTFDTGSDQVLGIGRDFEGQRLLALFNFGDREQEISLRVRQVYTNLCGRETVCGCVKLAPFGFVWLVSD